MADFERDGETCWFVSEERMLEGIENDEFLDVGKHDNYVFGTTFAAVRSVMAENKLCIIDCKPEVRNYNSLRNSLCISVFEHPKHYVQIAFILIFIPSGLEIASQFYRIPSSSAISFCSTPNRRFNTGSIAGKWKRK